MASKISESQTIYGLVMILALDPSSYSVICLYKTKEKCQEMVDKLPKLENIWYSIREFSYYND